MTNHVKLSLITPIFKGVLRDFHHCHSYEEIELWNVKLQQFGGGLAITSHVLPVCPAPSWQVEHLQHHL